MKSDLLLAVTQLAAERNLPASVVVSAVQDALTMAYKRDPISGGEDVLVSLDAETGDVTIHTVRNVVEEVEDPEAEWTLEEAQKVDANAQIGDQIKTGVIEENPGRIAAQTAKQLVMQRLRDAERELVYDEYVGKEGEVVTATVQRMDPRFITLDLGRAEAVMPPTEQVQRERYRPGMRLKIYISEVRRTVRGPEIVASRTHIELLRRLFETEVPEIFNGVVEIKAIAREPGARSKVAVSSNQEGVDPVGACVGLRGIRIQNVVNELMGEKIDVVEWSDNPAVLISSSLSPAQVDKVILNADEQNATVIVPDRQLSLAIGREGQNARLAAKLTGWSIDIKSTLDGAPTAATVDKPGGEAVAEAADAAEAAIAAEAEPAVPEETREEAGADIAAEAKIADAPETPESKAADESEVAEDDAASEAVARAEEIVEAAAEKSADAVSAEEELALAALEEELRALEAQEKAEQERREAELAASAASVDSEEIWQVGGGGGSSDSGGGLRFAEDILEYRDMSSGRRSRRGRGGNNLSPKARRAAARKKSASTNDSPASSSQ
ncbi:MAG: transcription termination/antitermination protein NusA [Chloroflexi bacterium]|nr:transcription termination/antitermination protein NusA [Chloroflexota bacterium]